MDDDSESVFSETSTVDFEHEPFDTFQTKVKNLVHQLWSELQLEDVEIERMKGGSFNRIIGVSVFEAKPKPVPFSRAAIRTFLSKCLGL